MGSSPPLSPPRGEVLAVAPAIWKVVERHPVLGAVTHKDADGDTLGSALGLAQALEPQGKRMPVVSSRPVPGAWWFLPGIERVNRDPLPEGVPLFVFDSTDAERTGEHLDAVREASVVVNVDHHVTNARFGTLNLVVTDAASAGELVYDLLKAWQLPVPPAAASCLYASILSDTGGFRHGNTSERALRAAAELVAQGADPALMARGLFKSRPSSTLRMQARILQQTHFEYDDRLVWAAIRLSDLVESGATVDQADGAIDQLNTVRDQELAILFKEVSPRLIKVSLRSRDRIDAAALAALFGGGGHRRAAGMEMAMPLAQAEAEVLAAARARLSQS